MVDDSLSYNIERERQEAIETSRSSLLAPFAAGIGAIALGTYLLRSNISKSGSIIADLVHLLGHPNSSGLSKIERAMNIGNSSGRSGTAGTRNLSSATYNVSSNELKLGPIDLITELRNSMEMMGSSRVDVARKQADRVTEYIHRRQQSVGATSSFFGHDLQRLTVGNVISDPDTWKARLGLKQWDTLEAALKKKLITPEVYLDTRIFQTKTGIVRDTRISPIFHTGILGKLGGVNPFGQGEVIQSILGSSLKITALGSEKGRTGARFFVDGNVYAYNSKGEEVLLHTGRRLRFSGDPLEAVSAARQGNLERSRDKIEEFYKGRPVPDEIKKRMVDLELKTGVGFGYATRHSFFDRYILNPIRRYSGIASGKAVVWKNPYKLEGKGHKMSTAFLGAEFPEAIRSRGTIEKIKGGGQKIDVSTLSFKDRFMVLFDLHDDYSVIKTSSIIRRAGNYKLSNKDLFIPVPEGGLDIRRGKGISKSFSDRITDLHTEIVTKAGEKVEVTRPRYYDVEKGKIPGTTQISDFINYLFYRVNSLASDSLLGIGFAPGRTIVGSGARLAAIPIIYEGLRETLSYADYLLEDLTGFSPKKMIADVYATGRVFQQKLREITGIQGSAQFLEENFPGSVDSEASFIARSIAAPLGVAIAGLKKGTSVGMIGAMSGLIYAAIGGPGLAQSSRDLEREYAGEKKVPVRKSRFWGLGYSAFGGDRPEHFEHSWYHRLKNDVEFSTYGGKAEYFKYHQNVFGIPVPTLHNLMGMRNLFNPYKWEEQNYYDRPYPETGSPLEAFPIIGPFIGGTLGKILKPTRYRTPEELPLLQAGVVDRGLQPHAAELLGIPSMNASEQQIENPNHILTRIKKQADIALEPTGIYKFVMEFFGVKLTPSENRIATSDIPTSPGRDLYSRSYGGAFFQTELLRRYMLSEYSNVYSVSKLFNPIANTMPGWLPGAASANPNDRSYFIDFHHGDPYTKIRRGEERLPGKTYERTHALHSGQEGVYSPVDRLLILADVAPYSTEFRNLERMIANMPLTEDWAIKVEEALSQRKQVIGVDNRYNRIEDELIDMNKDTKYSALYYGARKTYDFITHDILAEIPYFGSKIFPFRNPKEQFRKMYVEGAEYASWDQPYEAILRPMYYDMAYEDPLTAAMKGGVIGGLLSGPLSFFLPINMFRNNMSAAALYGAAAGSVVSAGNILAGNNANSIPSHVQKESEAIEYMDKWTYLKSRTLSEVAMEQGNIDLAKSFNAVSRKTMVGATNPIMMKASMPSSTSRRYLEAFSNAPVSMRESIIESVPDYMANALVKQYNNTYGGQDQHDQEVADYFYNQPLPSSNFLGWHPSVPSAGAKMKFIDHGINGVSDNIHRFGFYESQKNEIENRFEGLLDQEIIFQPPQNFETIRQLMNHVSPAVRGVDMSLYGTPTSQRQIVNMYSDNRVEKTYYLQDYMRI